MRALLLGLCLIATTSQAEMSNNDVIKYCLDSTGYTPENFYTYNFSEASSCYHGWKTLTEADKAAERRAFLENNPWYKGSNFNWTQNAEYTCEKIYSTQLMNTITVCSKPIFLN